MATPIVKTATVSDEASAIAVVVLAFSADPAVRWTWPDPNQYLMHFPSFVRAFGGNAFAHESAYYVDVAAYLLSDAPYTTALRPVSPCLRRQA
jgi:hypothetical protein